MSYYLYEVLTMRAYFYRKIEGYKSVMSQLLHLQQSLYRPTY